MISPYCKVEGCERPVENRDTGLCSTHSHEQRDNVRKLKKDIDKMEKAKPVKKVSEKRKIEQQVYSKKAAAHIKKVGRCEWPVFECKAKLEELELHHMQGRTGDLYLDESKWKVLCGEHHQFCTTFSHEAIELGLSLPRNQNTQTI